MAAVEIDLKGKLSYFRSTELRREIECREAGVIAAGYVVEDHIQRTRRTKGNLLHIAYERDVAISKGGDCGSGADGDDSIVRAIASKKDTV